MTVFMFILGDREVVAVCDEVKIDETIARMSEVIDAKKQYVSLVVTGDDLSNIVLTTNLNV